MKPIASPLLFSFIAFLWSMPSYAQWVKTTGPDSVRVLQTTDLATVYAGTRSGVFRSSDSGATWVALNSGLTNTKVKAITRRSGLIFVGTEGGGIFRSTNNAVSWTPVNSGLTGLNVRSLAFSRNLLFAGTNNGVFRSADSGMSWTSFNLGMKSVNISSLAASHPFSTELLAGTDSGLFRNTNDSSGWTFMNIGLTDLNVRTIGHVENFSCVGVDSKIFFRRPWTSWSSFDGSAGVRAIAGSSAIPDGSDDVMYAATASGVIASISLSSSQPWVAINQGLTDLDVHAIAVGELTLPMGYLFAGTNGGVWRRPVSEVVSFTSIKGSELGTHEKFQVSGRKISFRLNAPADVAVTAYDLEGRKRADLMRGKFPVGIHSPDVDAGKLPDGLYVFRLQTGPTVVTRRVLWTK